MSIEFIIGEMVEARVRAGEEGRKRLEDRWDKIARAQAVEEIEIVLAVYRQDFEIGDLQISRYIKRRHPNGNPYAKVGGDRA